MQTIDIQAAYFFNSFVQTNPFWQNFWAFFNSRASDWLYDGIMIVFALYFILEKEHATRCVKILLLGLFMLFCHNFFNHYLLQKVLAIQRSSPMDVLPDLFNLSSAIHWTRVKIRSATCFPADHAHTCCMFVIGMFHLMGRKRGTVALVLSVPFIMARLPTGAHWLTDILLGSLLLALFNLTWFFYLMDKYEQKIRNTASNA